MDNVEIINKFIDKIVVNFEENYITKSIIKKLVDMYNSHNLTTDGNSIISKSKRIQRTISIDIDNKKLQFQDVGNGDNQSFYSELIYSVDKDKAVVHKYNTDIKTIQMQNGLLTRIGSIYDTYEYFTNNKITGSSDINKIIKEIQTQEGSVVAREINDFVRTLYKLANGDVIKIINDNGNYKYYYCDSNVLANRETQNERKYSGINIELSKNQADVILKSSDDAYKLINNSTIYNIRKSSYK